MPKGLKVSHPLFANLILFINISIIYMMTFSIAHLDTSDDSFAFLYARGSIIEHTNGKCHVFTL